MSGRTTVDCPHPHCDAKMGVSPDTPADEYGCKCQACTVRLTWITRTDFTRYPILSLVAPQKESEAADATG